MQVVIDANVFISGLFWKGSAPSVIVDRVISGRIVPVFSFATWEELEVALSRVAGSLGEERLAREFLADLEAIAYFTAAESLTDVCRDPRDNAVLAAALASGVKLIVSGDKDLLALKTYGGIRILSPGDFINQ